MVSLTNYGAFVELEPGVEGLVHVSEMSWTRRVRHPSKIVNVGDEVDVIVLDVNRATKRISLGMKQVEADPWATIDERYSRAPRARARCATSPTSAPSSSWSRAWTACCTSPTCRGRATSGIPRRCSKKGQEIETQILNVDRENKRISLGLKQIQPDPWTTVAQRYPDGLARDRQGRAPHRLRRVRRAGAGRGRPAAHLADVQSRPIATPDEIVNVGDELTLLVIRVDPNERRIGLSLKELRTRSSTSRCRSDGAAGAGGPRKRARRADDDYDEED